MHRVQHLKDWATRRRLTACLLLVLSLLMVLPVSMQCAVPDTDTGVAGKDLSAPFPCQARACGCRSAKQCWKKCCCFTDTQKVAWAKAHRVTLPAFVVAAANRESSVAKGTCESAESCCEAGVRREGEAPRPRVRLVVGVEALQCSGVEQTIAGVLISLVPPELLTVSILNLGTGEVMPLADSSLAPSELEPPTPPPRIVIA